MTHFLAGLILAGTCAALTIPDAPIIGRAQAIDGDTLKIADARIRLWGIDAPEKRQAYGPEATYYLQHLTEGKDVSCAQKDTDKYGRVVAQCTVMGRDLGLSLVANGLAVDYTRYSRGYYKDAENAARMEHLGMWATPNPETPEHFRHRSN